MLHFLPIKSANAPEGISKRIIAKDKIEPRRAICEKLRLNT